MDCVDEIHQYHDSYTVATSLANFSHAFIKITNKKTNKQTKTEYMQ